MQFGDTPMYLSHAQSNKRHEPCTVPLPCHRNNSFVPQPCLPQPYPPEFQFFVTKLPSYSFQVLSRKVVSTCHRIYIKLSICDTNSRNHQKTRTHVRMYFGFKRKSILFLKETEFRPRARRDKSYSEGRG